MTCTKEKILALEDEWDLAIRDGLTDYADELRRKIRDLDGEPMTTKREDAMQATGEGQRIVHDLRCNGLHEDDDFCNTLKPRIVAECWTCAITVPHSKSNRGPLRLSPMSLEDPIDENSCRAAGHDVREVKP